MGAYSAAYTGEGGATPEKIAAAQQKDVLLKIIMSGSAREGQAAPPAAVVFMAMRVSHLPPLAHAYLSLCFALSLRVSSLFLLLRMQVYTHACMCVCMCVYGRVRVCVWWRHSM